MKKFFIFFFLLISFYSVSATEFNMNNYTSATLNGTKNRYRATEIYNTGQSGIYSFNTRYNGQISDIETYFEYPFSENITYTLTYNMATNDFRNNFASSYWWDCSQSMTNINAVVQGVSFISKQKVKFTFKPSENTTCIRVWLRSSNLATTPITGISNWQLNSITIYDPEWQSGSGSGQGSITPPTPSPNANQDIINNNNNNTQDIINNNNQNSQDIINNNNQNTQDIIDNQNANQEQTNQLLGSCYKNLYNYLLVNSLTNLSYSNGSYIQSFADTLSEPRLKLQFYSDLLGNNFVQSDYTPTIALGTFKWTFIKTSNLNYMSFGVNGSNTDSLVNFYDISNLENGLTYSLIYTVSNITQGSITLTDVMLINGYDTIPYTPYNKTYCKSKLDSVGDTILNGAGSIIDSVNQSQQDIINNQNSNTQKEIESEKSCNLISSKDIDDKGYLQSNGSISSSSYFGITKYIHVNDLYLVKPRSSSGSLCFYSEDYSLISCKINSTLSVGKIELPNNTYYIRATIHLTDYLPVFRYCLTGNQAINDNLNNLNDNITNSNVDSDVGNGFFDNFTNNMHGLSSIITIPLTSIQSLSSSTCTPLHFPIPFTDNKYLDVPCMTDIYEQHVPTLLTLIQTCWYGILAYKVLVNIFGIVKGFKDPDSDKIEVMDL